MVTSKANNMSTAPVQSGGIPSGGKESGGRFHIDLRDIFPFLGMIFVIIYFAAGTGGRLFNPMNLRAMLNDGMYILIGAAGYIFLLAQGNLDFSIGANMGMSCTVGCIAAIHLSPVMSVPAAILTGATIGLVNALIFVKGGINSFIVTLAMQFVLNGSILMLLSGKATLMAPLSMLSWYTNGLKIALVLVCVILGFIVYQFTPYGKICRAIGSNEEAVRQSGIHVALVKIVPFVVMGAICGLLGFVSLVRTGTASNQTGSLLMMNVLNAVLLGGLPISGGPTAKFRATVIGSVTMTVMASGMVIMQFSSVTQQIVKGLVFLIAITVSFDRRNSKIIK